MQYQRAIRSTIHMHQRAPFLWNTENHNANSENRVPAVLSVFLLKKIKRNHKNITHTSKHWIHSSSIERRNIVALKQTTRKCIASGLKHTPCFSDNPLSYLSSVLIHCVAQVRLSPISSAYLFAIMARSASTFFLSSLTRVTLCLRDCTASCAPSCGSTDTPAVRKTSLLFTACLRATDVSVMISNFFPTIVSCWTLPLCKIFSTPRAKTDRKRLAEIYTEHKPRHGVLYFMPSSCRHLSDNKA